MPLNFLITESPQEGRLRLSLPAYLCTSPEVFRRVPTAKSFSKVLTASPLAIHPRASITVITHTFEETELSSMMRRRSKRRARTLTEAIHYGRFEPSIGGGHRCDHIKKDYPAILRQADAMFKYDIATRITEGHKYSYSAEDEYAPADTSPGECKKPTRPVSSTDRSDNEMRSEQLPLRSRRGLKELLTACTHNASSAEFSLKMDLWHYG
ncbi:hypothetical protein ARMGADRAFT_1035704 [Armillaria gallica]|uniref:Uncharacterized protein n=1 Tax=Armillaria gallica TaxID=47427 RepID=A0A2H3CWQ1_ARMGA|nr:hypothetical protein ARMGADRAFT_1035704 [Armillaria gallica]